MSDDTNIKELAEQHLAEILERYPNDWENRKKLAQLLYNDNKIEQAAEIIWEAPEIPSIDLELGFAIKILGKGTPKKCIRLLTSVLELNEGKAVQNLGIANALMHYGMVMEAARFYGAALAIDSSLANPDLEHFLLWVDDKEKLWGDFDEAKPGLAELPWMKRDAKEAELLKKAMKGHTTPVKIPNLVEVTAEQVVHDMYVQSPRPGTPPTPPPAVTIPMDRVNPKDVLVDPERGASEPVSASEAQQAMGPIGGSSGQPLPPSPPASGQLLTPSTPGTGAKSLLPGGATPSAPPTPTPTGKLLTPATPAAGDTIPATPAVPATPATPPQPKPLAPPAPTPTGKLLTPATPAAPATPATPPQPKPLAPPTPKPTGKLLTPATPAAGDNTPATPSAPAAPATPATPAAPPEPKPLTPEAPAATPAASITDKPATAANEATVTDEKSPATDNAEVPLLRKNPESNATALGEDGQIIPNPITTQRLGSTAPPLLKPIQTTTLIDGKIVINKSTTDKDKDKGKGEVKDKEEDKGKL